MIKIFLSKTLAAAGVAVMFYALWLWWTSEYQGCNSLFQCGLPFSMDALSHLPRFLLTCVVGAAGYGLFMLGLSMELHFSTERIETKTTPDSEDQP